MIERQPQPSEGGQADAEEDVPVSYLDPPRLHFAGTFLTNPSTINNAIENYSPTIVYNNNPPSDTHPNLLAIRRAATGPENEVWTADPGVGVTVADLGAGTVVSNIATPSIPVASTPIGIGFTNDGSVAFEVVAFGSPDSAGNNGALVVFDVFSQARTTASKAAMPSFTRMEPEYSGSWGPS